MATWHPKRHPLRILRVQYITCGFKEISIPSLKLTASSHLKMDGWKMYWCISYWVSAYFPGDSLGIPIQDSVLMGTRVARSTFMLVIALVSRCFKKKTGKNGEKRGKRGKRKKWWFSKGNPLISGKSRLVKYYNLARWCGNFVNFQVKWPCFCKKT